MELDQESRHSLSKRWVPIQSDFAQVTVPALPDIPGMITPAEGRYLYWLVSETYTGSGAIVELGCWLGKSTSYLAAGLRDSGNSGEIHSFDRFIWINEHEFKAPGLGLKSGDDFRPAFENNLRALGQKLTAHKGTFAELSWAGDPIEVLFLDGPKDFDSLSSTLKVFGSSVLQETGVVVIQDYLHPVSFVLALIFERLKDRLQLVHVVEDGQTAAFRVTAPLTFPDGLPADWSLPHWSAKEIMDGFHQTVEPLGEWSKKQVALAPAFLLYGAGHKAEATEFIRNYKFSAEEEREWRRWFNTGYYATYPELFHATGLKRSQGSLLRKAARKLGLGRLKSKLSGRN